MAHTRPRLTHKDGGLGNRYELGAEASGGSLAATAPWLPQIAQRVGHMLREAQPEGDPARPPFDARYAAQAAVVARLCRRLLGRSASAEDAAQEIFVRAQRGYAGYDPEQSFRSWLLAVASHHCIDVLRRRSHEGRLFGAADFDPAGFRDPGPSPLGHALDAERRAQLLAAVDALPDRYRLPLVLRHFQDLDYAAIAETLGVSRENVGVLLLRARRRLRDALDEGSS